MSENNGAANQQENGDKQEQSGKLFTPEQQAEVNRIVQERVQRVEAKYSDYDDLKTRAAGAQTLEERVGTLESELKATRTDELRTRIASKFGISAEKGAKGEPSDADILLTGSDEAAMTRQAELFSGRVADQKKNGNRAPKEGQVTVTTLSPKDAAKREWLQSLSGD